MINKRHVKWGFAHRFNTVIIYFVVSVFALFCVIPFWMVFINSFAEESILRVQGYQLWPQEFSLNAYIFLFGGGRIYSSYMVTITVTVVGTLSAVMISSAFAYGLSHPMVRYRNILSFMTYFTMVFGAGMVGQYLLIVNWLGLKDTLWALILPYLLNPFFTFILVAYFRGMPHELREAAMLDGANELRIYFQIMLPLAKPAVATVSLLYALQYWNDFWLALMYIDNHRLHPLQLMIRQLISNLNAAQYIGNTQFNYQVMTPSYGIQLATVCLTIGPIIFLYPFLQRYFVSGLTIGAVKG